MIGPPLDICSRNRGITDPEEFITLPNLTIDNLEFWFISLRTCTAISAILLDAPITFVGLTALSVEINTNDLTFAFNASFASLYVPIKLFSTDLEILFLSCTSGTCLNAAAWYMVSMACSEKILFKWIESNIFPNTGITWVENPLLDLIIFTSSYILKRLYSDMS